MKASDMMTNVFLSFELFAALRAWEILFGGISVVGEIVTLKL